MRLLFEINSPDQFPLPSEVPTALTEIEQQFAALDVGESFLVPDKLDQSRCKIIMSRLNRTTTNRYVSRLMTTGRRFWRKL